MISLSDSAKAWCGYGLIFGIAGGLVLLHVSHTIRDGEGLSTFVFGILLPMTLCLFVCAGGIWLRRDGAEPDSVLRVGLGCAVGATVLTVGAVLTVLYQRAHGVVMNDQLYVTANLTSFGVLIGFVLGVYVARQRVVRARAATARDRAERQGRQLSVLNRVLRHDLRNHANAIHGHANLLADDPAVESTRVETVRNEAASLVAMSRQARDVEQFLRKVDVDHEVVDVVAVVEAQIDRIRTTYPDADVREPDVDARTEGSDVDARTEESGVDVRTERSDVDARTDAHRVRAHPRLDSAIANVMDNAVLHNDKERPRVAVAVSRDEDGAVEVRIADNGPGIPDYEVAVLERGYETQLEHTSGLGLWLVNWIVSESGGTVRFEENEPDGSAVCLRFERAPGAAVD